MKTQGIHHVAYRCKNAKQTMEFYRDMLNMEFMLAIAEDQVPSTKAPDPYMHIFMDSGRGNVLAFFELPNSPAMDRDQNTPEWVQHIAFEVSSVDDLVETKQKLEDNGIDVVGITDHTIFKSIYFFDPNGHRIELAAKTDKPGMLPELKRVSQAMLEQWDKTKKAPNHAAWLHNGEDFQQE